MDPEGEILNFEKFTHNFDRNNLYIFDVNQPDNLKAFRKLDWTNKAKKLKEDITKSGVVYDRGVWIDPFIEDKISKSLLIPCIYPVVINNEYKGFVASCLTVYSNDYI